LELPLLMFLIVTAGLCAGFGLLTNLLSAESSAIRRRVKEEFGQGKAGGKAGPLFKNLDQLSLDIKTGGMSDLGMAEMQGTAPAAGRPGLRASLQEKLDQAGLAGSANQLLAVAAGLAVVAGLCGWAGLGPGGAALAAAAGAALPLWYVHAGARKRSDRFLSQLPDAFDLMARVLRGGQSVPQALQAVAESTEPPVSAEFAQCQKQMGLGLRAEITFQELARRTGVVEMRIFVMALLIQRQVGGSLSEVLERLAMVIRARLKLKNQVRTLTAEGRLQALTLLVLPFVLFGAMLVVNRSYALQLLNHVQLLAATGVAMLVGTMWIRKIVDFEV
jgi:tight adherence protein B